MHRRKSTLAIIGVIIFALIGWGIVTHFQHKASSATTPKLLTIQVTPLRYYHLPQTIMTYGTTISPQSVNIHAQSAGVVFAVHFKGGEKIKAGQLLFSLQTSDVSDQLNILKSKLIQAKSYYERLTKEQKQVPNSVAKYDLLKAKTAYNQALSAYQEALKINHIDSPINGIISDTIVTKGSYVTGGESLATVTAPDSLEVRYQVPGRYANQVRLGQPIFFYPHHTMKPYSGKVSYVSPSLNVGDNSLTLRASLDNPQTLRDSLFGRIKQVLDPSYKMLAIPQKLVQTDAQGFYIYSVAKSKVTKIYFKPGQVTAQGLIQVKSGLHDKTPIISSNTAGLSVGQKVKVASK